MSRLRQEADADAARSEGRFNAVLQPAPAILWITDLTLHAPSFLSGWYDYHRLQARRAHWAAAWLNAGIPMISEEARRSLLDANTAEPFSLSIASAAPDGEFAGLVPAGRASMTEGTSSASMGSVTDVNERKQAGKHPRC